MNYSDRRITTILMRSTVAILLSISRTIFSPLCKSRILSSPYISDSVSIKHEMKCLLSFMTAFGRYLAVLIE